MYRIEVEKLIDDEASSTSQSETKSFFVSLGTGPLSIGRTGGDIQFPGDKSVSRNHCSIRVESRSRLESEGKLEGFSSADLKGIRLGNSRNSANFLSQQTATQTQTNSNSNSNPASTPWHSQKSQFSQFDPTNSQGNNNNPPTQNETSPELADLVLVINTKNSKFGTFIFLGDAPPNPQGSYKELPKGENIILSLDPELDTGLLRVGAEVQLRSASLIRITRCDLIFCLSIADKDKKRSVEEALPKIGARSVKIWSSKTTHLVTEKKKTTAKNLCAWGSNRPVVTPEYVLKFAERKVQDDLPLEVDFNPAGANIASNPPTKNVFSTIRFLAFGDDDNSEICRLGGGSFFDCKKQAASSNDSLETFSEGLWLDEFESDHPDRITVLLDLLKPGVEKGERTASEASSERSKLVTTSVWSMPRSERSSAQLWGLLPLHNRSNSTPQYSPCIKIRLASFYFARLRKFCSISRLPA